MTGRLVVRKRKNFDREKVRMKGARRYIIGLILIVLPVIDYGNQCCITGATNPPAMGKVSKTTTTQKNKKKNNTGKTKKSTKQNVGSGKTNNSKKKTPNTSADAKKQQQAVREEIHLTEAQIKENDVKVSKGLAQLNIIESEISATSADIEATESKVAGLEKEIKEREGKIKGEEEELAKLRNEYLKAIKKMRATKRKRSMMAFIFSSENMSQALRRMRYLREFSDWRARQTASIEKKIEKLNEEKGELAKMTDEQQKNLAKLTSDKEKLSRQRDTQQALVAQLKQNKKALEDHLRRKQSEARDLDKKVSQLIAEEQRKAEEQRRLAEQKRIEEQKKAEEQRRLAEQKRAEDERKSKDSQAVAAGQSANKQSGGNSSSSSTEYADARKRAPRAGGNTGSGNKPAGGTPGVDNSQASGIISMKGKLPAPTSGSFTVISGFGRQSMPDLPGVEFDNPGIDAQTEAGGMARAVYGGVVSGVYLLPGYNTVVILNHGDYYTVYGNISSPSVKVGDNVATGTNLGTLALSDDESGNSAIHFELWKNRDKLNPLEWLR